MKINSEFCLLEQEIEFFVKLLDELTDENHYLTTVQIINLLEERYSISSHRTTIAQDIDVLKKIGMDIDCIPSTQNRYRILSRRFDNAELKLLIDAVASSKFISKRKSTSLAERLSSLTSTYEAEKLKRNISVENRIKSENELTLLIIDAINEAINQKKQIRFQYFRYNEKKKRIPKWDGYWYQMSPHRLVWNGDYYYVLGYYEKYDAVVSYRVDRIVRPPEIMGEDALPMPKGFNLDRHINSMFRMYSDSAERIQVKLLCDNDLMDAIIDRFGKSVKTKRMDEGHFETDVAVAVNSVFFSWIFGFGGKVKIAAPEVVSEQYAAMVRAAAKGLE